MNKLEWTRDEIEALLKLVHVPNSGTMDNRLDYAMGEMTSTKFNFPIRPMYECREKYYENVKLNNNNMTAKEARTKTEQQILTSTESDYTKIMAEIEKAIKKGEFQIIYYNAINQTIKGQLEVDGFTVNVYNDWRDGSSTVVKW